MITVIHTTGKASASIPEGTVWNFLGPSVSQTNVEASRYKIDAGKTIQFPVSERSQLIYILEGDAAEVSFTSAGKTETHPAKKLCGVYLEPGEEAAIKASTPLVLLRVAVPKYTGKPIDAAGGPPHGYFFDEKKLQVLVDEKQFRIRTFWVNKETGLSRSWDLQIGRMVYLPKAHAPRHVHHASKTSTATPEHFYMIEEGVGYVNYDGGSHPLNPGDLVLIPAGDWHQLHATETGLNYLEFQGPFDFTTTMDHDPLGKNWYVQGTEDANGKLRLWVQS
jgi:mannose-6-phosphate isomerase-like protein (cupin superfamily)